MKNLKQFSANKASGLDGVSTKLIKYGSNAIAAILCKIYVPNNLIVARVTPIYTSGSKDDFSNYRPISILPICSKILKRRLFTSNFICMYQIIN